MRISVLAGFLFAAAAVAQDRSEAAAILERLDRLEAKNRELLEEIGALRKQLAELNAKQAAASSEAPVEERVAVAEHRIEELDQSRVSSDHQLPIRLTGTLVFNAFLNGRNSGDSMNPAVASLNRGFTGGGASLRQSIIGVRYDGPELPGGGKASGTLFADFFAGTGTALNQLVRLRVATLDLAWKNTTITVGQDKPIMAPRDPDSFAQIALSPLTGAGNLWIWEPQVRLEQRFAFGARRGLKAQAGLYQTNEGGAGVPSEYAGSTPRMRPGVQGRFEFWGESEGGRRWELAPSFHLSTTHTDEQSVPSRVVSIDWLFRPFSRLDFTGQLFTGENAGVIGGLQQGVAFHDDIARAVGTIGGWAQITYRATPRLTFHAYGGQQDDRNRDLIGNAIAKNQIYAGNVTYRLGSNVITAFEYSRTRTTYLNSGIRINPHYDLALAYLF